MDLFLSLRTRLETPHRRLIIGWGFRAALDPCRCWFDVSRPPTSSHVCIIQSQSNPHQNPATSIKRANFILLVVRVGEVSRSTPPCRTISLMASQ